MKKNFEVGVLGPKFKALWKNFTKCVSFSKCVPQTLLLLFNVWKIFIHKKGGWGFKSRRNLRLSNSINSKGQNFGNKRPADLMNFTILVEGFMDIITTHFFFQVSGIREDFWKFGLFMHVWTYLSLSGPGVSCITVALIFEKNFNQKIMKHKSLWCL